MSRKIETKEFNPFIVLSDITMATLVVICCLLMVYLHLTLKSADIAKKRAFKAEQWLARYHDQLRRINENKKSLQEAIDKIGYLGVGFPYSWSRGTTKVLFRIGGNAYNNHRSYPLFRDNHLTDEGRAACLALAIAFATPLKNQMYSKENQTPGYLSEIQIQGHCGSQSSGDLWRLSIDRALEVKEAMSAVSEFPSALFTVSGAADVRQAYRSTDDYVKAETNKIGRNWQTLSYDEVCDMIRSKKGNTRQRLPDRIDITFVYAGGISDDSLVPARDPITNDLLGPKIDTAHDQFDADSYSRDKYREVFLLEDLTTSAPSSTP